MDTDLLTVARTLAERGWLPGILVDLNPEVTALFITRWGRTENATEADLHLAAHNEIVRRGWHYECGSQGTIIDTGNTWGNTAEPRTTTLSLLRALLRACEEHEKKETKP